MDKDIAMFSRKVAETQNLFSSVSPRESVRNQAWLADNIKRGGSQVFSVVINITPALAEILLQRNEGNRPLRTSAVTKYVRRMKAGIWTLTGEAIVMSKTGRLLNGQHRLRAVIDSGVTIPTLMVFGIDDDAFAYMDDGVKRSAGDIFDQYGVSNASAMAAAAMWVWRSQKSGMALGASSYRPSNEELYEYYLEHDGLQKSYTPGNRFCKYKLAPVSLCIALHYLFSQKSKAQADVFMEKVATGVGLSAKEPAKKLRDKLVEGTKGSARIDDTHIAVFFIQAWNAERLKKTVNIFRWRGAQNPNEPVPGIV